MRGKLKKMEFHLKMDGSSPRMRGKRVDASNAPEPWGLIPAHAGKTYKVLSYLR